MRLVSALTIGLLLSSGVLFPQQESLRLSAKLVHRSERGCGHSCLQELAIELGGVYAAKPGDKVAVRFCSKESLPVAFATAAASPEYLISILTGSYGYTPDRLLFLRSEDCLGLDTAITVTEFWAVPNGSAPPSAVESTRADQVRLEPVGRETPSTLGTSNYRAATRELTAKLRSRPEAVGVVLGYYYDRPSRLMKKRVLKVRRALQKSGLPEDRYSVRLIPWNGERSVNPPEPEPVYPSIFIVERTAH